MHSKSGLNKKLDRHWDHFVPDKKNNLFAAQLSFSGDRYSIEGRPRNLLRGTNLVWHEWIKFWYKITDSF